MEPLVKTTPFTIDRNSYAPAKIWLLLRQALLPSLLLVVACAVYPRPPLYWAVGFLALVHICVIQTSLSRIYGSKYRHIVDAVRVVEFGESEVRISAEGIGDSRVSWSTFTGVETIKDWTFLMQDRYPMVAIPASAFRSDEDRQLFLGLMARKKIEFRQRKRSRR